MAMVDDLSVQDAASDACRHGRVEDLRNLLPVLDPNGADTEGCLLLQWAAINGRLEIVDLLLASGARPSESGGVIHETALHWAIREGHTRVVARLLDAGADAMLYGSEGLPALHLAVLLGKCRCALLLLARDAALGHVRDQVGRTPLHLACDTFFSKRKRRRSAGPGNPLGPPSLEPIRCLLALGADPNAREPTNGDTCLHLAVRLELPCAAAEELLAAGADPSLRNDEGETAAALGFGSDHVESRPWRWLATTLAKVTGRAAAAKKSDGDGLADPLLDDAAADDDRGTSGSAAADAARASRHVSRRESVANVGLPVRQAVAAHVTSRNAPKRTPECVPFVGIGTAVAAPLLFTAAPACGAVVTACSAGGCVLTSLDERHSLRCQLGLTRASVFFIAVTFACYLAPRAGALATLFYAGSTYMLVRSLNAATFSDPGFVDRPRTAMGRRTAIKALCASGKLHDASVPLCSTCCTVRPARAKHDAVTGRCVRRFDHYCPFIGNAVGRGNYRHFVAFLFWCLVAIGFHLVCLQSNMRAQCRPHHVAADRAHLARSQAVEAKLRLDDDKVVLTPKQLVPDDHPVDPLLCVLYTLHDRPPLGIMGLLALLHWIWIFLLFVSHVQLICGDQTTNEMIKGDKGASEDGGKGGCRRLLDFVVNSAKTPSGLKQRTGRDHGRGAASLV